MGASCLELPSDELQIVGCQLRCSFKDGNDATTAKAFVRSIFIEIKTTFLLVIEKINIELGKFLFDFLLVFASSECGRAVDTKAVNIDL